MELTGRQRKNLTKLAHGLSPVVLLGKNGLTGGIVKAVEAALESHELIKLRFIDWKNDKGEIAEEIAEKTGAVLIRIIGNTAIYYRQSSDPEKRRITPG